MSSKFPRPRDTATSSTSAHTQTTLADARVRWGLDAAPIATAPVPKTQPKATPHIVKALAKSIGTPLDFARALMAKRPPAEWEADLREISPVSAVHSYLIFAWKEPPLQPDLGRWCLYEAIPEAAIDIERRLLLSDAPYWELPTQAEREARSSLVSAFQWEMYRVHRVDVRPFWCLQGTAGGTPLHYDSIEKRYRRMVRQSDTPPYVGAFPYAPWDARVKRAVLRRDRLMKMGRDVDALKASGTHAAVASVREAREREFRREFWDYMTEKLGPRAEELGHFLKTGYTHHMRKQSKAEARAAEDARDVFIETGRIPDPIEYRDN